MKKLFFKVSKIKRIEVLDFRFDNTYEYRNRKRLLFGTVRKEGIYEKYSEKGPFEIVELPDHIMNHKMIFKKPRCDVYFDDGSTFGFHFEIFKEAEKRAEEIQNIDEYDFLEVKVV